MCFIVLRWLNREQIDDWRDVSISKDFAKAPRARLLGSNSFVTGFGNEFEVLDAKDAAHRSLLVWISEHVPNLTVNF